MEPALCLPQHLLVSRKQLVRTAACASGLCLRTTTLGKADGKSHLSRGKGARNRGTEQPQAG